MTDPSLTDLLRRLEALVGAQGAPVAANLRPGLPGDEVTRRLADAGLGSPSELQQWFSWHDGTQNVQQVADRCMNGRYEMLSLEESIEQYTKFRARYPASADSALLPWPSTWLPIATHENGNSVCVDCSSPTAAVYVRAWHIDETLQSASAPSLSALVELWIRGFDLGIWEFDADAAQWLYRMDRIPAEFQLSQLM